MLNVTRELSPDLIDVTPMVLMVLATLAIFAVAMLLFEISKEGKNKHQETVFITIAYVLIAVAFVLNMLLIKVSIDAGVQWGKDHAVCSMCERRGDE